MPVKLATATASVSASDADFVQNELKSSLISRLLKVRSILTLSDYFKVKFKAKRQGTH